MKYSILTFLLLCMKAISLHAEFTILSTTPTTIGECKGTLIALIEGPTAPYTVTAAGQQFTAVNGILTIEELCEGEVKLTIIDANGCEFKVVGHIVTWESCADLKTTLQGDYSNLISCESPNPTGSLNLSTSGGNAPYKYLWSTGATSSAVYGLGAGQYSVTVTDFVGCTVEKGFTVGEHVINIGLLLPPFVVPSKSATDGCNGQLKISIEGSTPNFEYSALWSNGYGFGPNNNMPFLADFHSYGQLGPTGLCPGTYTVTVSASNGCSETFTQEVKNCSSVPPLDLIELDYTKLLDCSQIGGGEISVVSVSGIPPYSYTLGKILPGPLWPWDENIIYSGSSNKIKGITEGGKYYLSIYDGCFRKKKIEPLYIECECRNPLYLLYPDRGQQQCFGSGYNIKFQHVDYDNYYSNNLHPKLAHHWRFSQNNHEIEWPNGELSTISIPSENGPYSIAGPNTFSPPIPDNYIVQITQPNGCKSNHCFSFNNPAFGLYSTPKFLLELEPNTNANLNHLVSVGVSTCETCRYGCEGSGPLWPNETNINSNSSWNPCFNTSTSSCKYELYPASNLSPCTNATIVATCAGVSIDVPTFVNGNEFVHYNEDITTTSDASQGYCRYKGACYFPVGLLDRGGIYPIYVETEFLKPNNQNCGTAEPVFEDCVSIFEDYSDHPAYSCYYYVYCLDPGHDTFALGNSPYYDEEATVYCYKEVMPTSGNQSCGLFSICLLGEGLILPEPLTPQQITWKPNQTNNCAAVPSEVVNIYGEISECSIYGYKPANNQTSNASDLISIPKKPNNITIYPNPFLNKFHIQNLGEDIFDGEIQLFNVYGSLIYSKSFSQFRFGSAFEITPTIELPPATYFVKVNSANHTTNSVQILIKK